MNMLILLLVISIAYSIVLSIIMEHRPHKEPVKHVDEVNHQRRITLYVARHMKDYV